MKENIRIRRVLTCYYRPKPGGFCKRYFRAINALLDRGHTVHYLAVVGFPIDHPSCHFHRFPWPQNKTAGYLFWGFFHLLAPIQLLCIGVRYQVNCVFTFGGHNYALMLQPLRVVKQLPMTLFVRGDAIEKHRTSGKPSLLVGLECILEGLGIVGTRMYGVSETLTNRIAGRHTLLKPSALGVLRNDIVKFPVNRLSAKQHAPLRLASVGILEPGKNQRFLLDVMEKIHGKQAQLYLFGVGPDEQFLHQKVIDENLADRVHLMGWVTADEIWPQVDLLLMPSLHEGAPNAVLEALGNSVPVLASDIPEHREILPVKSLLPLGDVTAWSETIREIVGETANSLEQIVTFQAQSMTKLTFDWDQKIATLICEKASHIV